VAGTFWANARHNTHWQKITFRVIMSIKIETLKSECKRGAEASVFIRGDIAYKQKHTAHTG
jgi:hypothetical protein